MQNSNHQRSSRYLFLIVFAIVLFLIGATIVHYLAEEKAIQSAMSWRLINLNEWPIQVPIICESIVKQNDSNKTEIWFDPYYERIAILSASSPAVIAKIRDDYHLIPFDSTNPRHSHNLAFRPDTIKSFIETSQNLNYYVSENLSIGEKGEWIILIHSPDNNSLAIIYYFNF